MNTIGDRIRRLRVLCGLTQQQLADKAGTTRYKIKCYESNWEIPNDYMLWRIAYVLNTNVTVLLGLSPAPCPEPAEEDARELEIIRLKAKLFDLLYVKEALP